MNRRRRHRVSALGRPGLRRRPATAVDGGVRKLQLCFRPRGGAGVGRRRRAAVALASAPPSAATCIY